jgi:hypothetical protein
MGYNNKWPILFAVNFSHDTLNSPAIFKLPVETFEFEVTSALFTTKHDELSRYLPVFTGVYSDDRSLLACGVLFPLLRFILINLTNKCRFSMKSENCYE